MNKCDIRVVTPAGRDRTALSNTFRRLGYGIAGTHDDDFPVADEITVVDARDTRPADWASIEHDLGEGTSPTVVISDEHNAAFVDFAKRLGRSVVFASGDSDVGYGVAVSLCTLMLQDQHAQVAA